MNCPIGTEPLLYLFCFVLTGQMYYFFIFINILLLTGQCVQPTKQCISPNTFNKYFKLHIFAEIVIGMNI